MKRWKKICLSILIILFLLIGLAYGALRYFTYGASSEAQQALTATTEISITETNDVIILKNTKKQTTLPAVIFYQGALVEAESYSLWAKELAAAGYPVYLCKQPLNLPILATDFAQKVIKKYEIQDYVIGGHSLGGTAASRYAAEHLQDQHLKGVFFLASYPDTKGAIADTKLAVLSLTGTEDGVLNWENYQESKTLLPQSTIFHQLPDGNHAGFGSYGPQRGDNDTILADGQQQGWIAKEMLDWLQQAVNKKS
ncbi:alpha/beta hydrolase [Isobaculum melis]|uniref:Alpha/beta hydrolase family protein n=1 Tax=Isobaculum melis TaxID=142588 RepID=A0A1H9PYB2_9LACT|nr:alpha/beta hydrolase [Isobaculum melis]SER52583.1 Alpha/beta hydrolase family protein [Isobaculum melis]